MTDPVSHFDLASLTGEVVGLLLDLLPPQLAASLNGSKSLKGHPKV